MDKVRPKYEVWIAKEWYRVKVAQVTPKGWLDYTLADGTSGLVPPGRWRILYTATQGK